MEWNKQSREMGTEKKAEKGREQTRPPRAGSCSQLAVLFWSFVCASPASCCRTLPPQAVAIDTGLLLYSAPSFSWAPNVALFLAIVLNMVSARCRSCKLDLRLVQNSELVLKAAQPVSHLAGLTVCLFCFGSSFCSPLLPSLPHQCLPPGSSVAP